MPECVPRHLQCSPFALGLEAVGRCAPQGAALPAGSYDQSHLPTPCICPALLQGPKYGLVSMCAVSEAQAALYWIVKPARCEDSTCALSDSITPVAGSACLSAFRALAWAPPLFTRSLSGTARRPASEARAAPVFTIVLRRSAGDGRATQD